MRDKIKIIAVCVLVVGLLGFLVISKNKKQDVLTFGNITTSIKNNDFSAIYFGSKSKEVDDVFASMKEVYGIKTYYCDTSLENINILLQKNNLTAESKDVYVLFANDTAVEVISSDYNFLLIQPIIDTKLFHKISEEDRKYKVAEDAAAISKLIRSKNYTVLVFGYDGCSYCTTYLPVINNIADKYKLDIYYFNRDTYDEDEYNKVMSLALEIPARCTLTGEDTDTSQSFPKPMTLITKNGKTVDCIRGYVEEDTVVEKLKSYKIIKG